MTDQNRWRRRLVAEFFVILVGVLVALAADRWFQRVDNVSAADEYLARVVKDLRGDSAVLASRAATWTDRHEFGLRLLRVAESGAQADSFFLNASARDFEMLPRFNPMVGRTAAWEDLVSTGNLSLLPAELRTALSDHYSRVRATNRLHQTFDEQMQVYEIEAWDVLPPLVRLSLLDIAESGPPPTTDALAGIVEALRNRPRLMAGLGQVVLLLHDAADIDSALLERTSDLIALVERRAP